jgi:hypothetical protein
VALCHAKVGNRQALITKKPSSDMNWAFFFPKI